VSPHGPVQELEFHDGRKREEGVSNRGGKGLFRMARECVVPDRVLGGPEAKSIKKSKLFEINKE